MAKFNKDSVGGTILVVLLLSLVCSIIVAGSAVMLKPAQEEQKLLDKQKNILNVAGLLQEKTNVKETYAKFIEPRFVDLATGDYVQQADDSQEAIPAEQDKARIRTRGKTAEIYLVKDEQGQTQQVILPIYGTGLWSVMYGLVSVQPDGNTVNGITYYQHGETPGLGGEIENPNWAGLFKGKKLFNEQHQPAIHIVKGQAPKDDHSVDGLSGATLTANGVQGTFDYWFSENGFSKYLEKLQAGAN
ncbi:Na(+)-translocating NADH-quinone reductase subunit C [Rodentibacter ratti]|uniref:Na(+)-translocating NADH-quinone reductase subunit C n=1 Tax=Rodentibacter ratti TaxID=1906745 RepID=A0A1V3L2I4_9PAST|nr:Na(+)-translocating NADH-quinone reductase subunit C [Rodentibacter ratti]OOF81650.1 Na(+)-translocating NADH-quinone reductase subunit C [Rodentibacter ratti]OOF84055.1 Na(+)-translocating NADH-quinone reductase subunit C [Rodentibacter ratti]OOF86300.1 Na(+)-translocating NADH-quinone reductase subunit C [Rodentibacter ratti]